MKLLCFYILFANGFQSLNAYVTNHDNQLKFHNGSYLAFIKFTDSLDFWSKISSFCSGSIISEYWIVTAAHCIIGIYYQKNVYIIHLKNGRGKIYNIDEIIVSGEFENHNGSSLAYYGDISLIKVEEKIKFDKYIQPIPISNTRPKSGNIITFAGYGTPQDNKQLQIVQASVIKDEECRKKWSDYDFILEEYIFCVEPKNFLTVKGNSGGPAVYNGKLVGILSTGGSESSEPDLFTSVAKYYDWILKHTGIKYED